MKTMHLFAGVGGGLLCDLILGHEPVVAVEWDSYACQVLRERSADGWFPGLHVWEGDVRLFDPSEYAGKVDCIHAGFPCQDISVAGNQAGVGEETRSGLYREVIRIAGIVRPRYLFLENVAAILSNGLPTVLGDTAAMGFDVRWLCIRASDVGAPHHRDRWFALADAERGSDDKRHEFEMQRGWSDEAKQTRVGCRREDVADIDSDSVQGVESESQPSADGRPAGLFGRTGSVSYLSADPADVVESSVGGMADEFSKWIHRNINMNNVGWWEVEANIPRVADGVSHMVHKLKGLGNAQVPLQAAVAWKLLKGGSNESPD